MTEAGSLILACGMAAAAGLVGCFALMRRMTLAADALSHVALPGIGLALMLGWDPLWGAVAALLLGAVLVWGLEKRTGISTETVTGVVFASALALGSLLATREELVDALFGAPGSLSPRGLAAGLAAEAGVVAFMLVFRKRLVLALVSPDIARTAGIRVGRLNLGYLLIFAVTVALGLRYLGVLLMGALIIIPAATAKRLAGSLHAMLVLSVAASVSSTLLGARLAASLEKPAGPCIILAAAALFCISLFSPAHVSGSGHGSGREPGSGPELPPAAAGP